MRLTGCGKSLPETFALALALCVSLGGCQKATPGNEPLEAEGTLKLALRQEIATREFARPVCSKDGEDWKVELPWTRAVAGPAGRSQRPNILTARIPDPGGDAEWDFERHSVLVSAPSVDFEGVDYPMLLLVANGLAQSDRAECRVGRKDRAIELICNGATVVPWLGDNPAPRGSFEVRFPCPS